MDTDLSDPREYMRPAMIESWNTIVWGASEDLVVMDFTILFRVSPMGRFQFQFGSDLNGFEGMPWMFV